MMPLDKNPMILALQRPKRYDIITDTFVPVDQKWVDEVCNWIQEIGLAAGAMQVHSARSDVPMGMRLAIFPNRMRNDGCYVAEDKPIEAYPGVRRMDGSPAYPSTPKTAFCIPNQLPWAFAAEIVRRWNLVADQESRE